MPVTVTGRSGECHITDTRPTEEGRALTAGVGCGFEHGKMGREVRKEHGHWHMEEKSVIF